MAIISAASIRQVDQQANDSLLSAFFYAHMEIPLANAFMASSIFIVICLTADRFAAVCTASKFKTVHTPKVARTAISICYVLGIIISIPLVLLKKVCKIEGLASNNRSYPALASATTLYSFIENDAVTGMDVWKAYTIFGEIIVRFGPAFILCVLNLRIIRTFRKVSRKKKEIQGGGDASLANTKQYQLRGQNISKKIYKEEKRLTVLLLSIVLLFFVTMTPVAFLAITYSQSLDTNFHFQVFRALANSLELCNFALNFYIYFLCCKEFRSKFLSFFECILPKKSEPRVDNFQSVTLPEMSKARDGKIFRTNHDTSKSAAHNV